METGCSKANCKNSGKYSCACEQSPQILCIQHLQAHIVENKSVQHSPTRINLDLSGEEISMLEKARAALATTKSTLNQKTCKEYNQKIVEITEQYQETLQAIFDKYIKALSKLDLAIQKAKIDESSSDDFVISICRVQSHPENIQETMLGALVSSVFSDEIRELPFNYSFKYNTTKLKVIDNLTMTKQRFQLKSLPEKLGNRAGICHLKDGTLFYCGGYTPSVIDSCYFINPDNRAFEKLPSIPQARCNIAPLVYDQSIYVFGGWNTDKLSSSLKFLLKEKRWVFISDLPVASQSVYSVRVAETILLAGSQTAGVYVYTPASDKYTKILDTVTGSCVLLKNKAGGLYLLTKTQIYFAYEGDLMDWHVIGEIAGNFGGIDNYPQLYGNCFYFKNNQFYWSFSFQNLALKCKRNLTLRE